MNERPTLLDTLVHPWPDPDKPRLETQPLLEVLPLEAMSKAIAASQRPETLIEAANDICTLVQQSFKWEPGAYPITYTAGGTYSEKIQANQLTNCFGFTIATSELLNRVGIEHYLAYMGGHAVTVVPMHREDGQELYLVNSDYPKINQYIGNTLIGRSPEEINQDIAAQKNTVAKIDTARLIINSGNYPDDFTHAGRNEWLYYQKSKVFRTATMQDDLRYQRRYQKIMTLYHSTLGRKALLAYGAFTQTYEHDMHIGLAAITELAGIFPEVDAREKHTEIRKLVRNLARAGHIIDACDAVGYYCSSMAVSKDPRAKALESKLWEQIAIHAPKDEIELAATGVAVYALRQARERERVTNPSAALAGHGKTLEKRIAQLTRLQLTT